MIIKVTSTNVRNRYLRTPTSCRTKFSNQRRVFFGSLCENHSYWVITTTQKAERERERLSYNLIFFHFANRKTIRCFFLVWFMLKRSFFFDSSFTLTHTYTHTCTHTTHTHHTHTHYTKLTKKKRKREREREIII